MENTETPLVLGMLLYPGLTLLDLVGPLTVFTEHAKIHLLSKTLDPVVSDSGIAMVPNTTLAECPAALDVLFVPGGLGTADAMKDAELIAFLKRQASYSRYITSVCTGSLILGAAGLLRGYKATSHWATTESLALFGAEFVNQRVVIDRNRVSGGGVTAGIDFGLTLLALLRGPEVAQMTQLFIEYNPQPPFNSGSPETASPTIVQGVKEMIAKATHGRELVAKS